MIENKEVQKSINYEKECNILLDLIMNIGIEVNKLRQIHTDIMTNYCDKQVDVELFYNASCLNLKGSFNGVRSEEQMFAIKWIFESSRLQTLISIADDYSYRVEELLESYQQIEVANP